MSTNSSNPNSATQSDNSGAADRARAGVGSKWIVGIAVGSAAGAALLVTSLSSTSAEAPVVADSAQVAPLNETVEKKAPAKTKSTNKKSESDNKDEESSNVVYKPSIRQSAVAKVNSATQAAQTQEAKTQTPKYGKNATEKSKVASKVKKTTVKQNMTEGKPPTGVPVEGPINHSE